MTARVPVCAMPSLDPAVGRIEIELPYGATVAQIIAEVLPHATEEMLDRARVWLVSNVGETLLSARKAWHRIRPRPGVRVLIKLVHGGDMLRNALMIAVSIGATALGQFWAGPMIGGLFGGSALAANIGAAAFAAGVTIAGGYLLNMLIPPARRGVDQQSERPLYQISGWKNSANPDGAVPSIAGRIRYAPMFAAPSYTEIVGDLQYVRALFTFGYGPVELSNLKLGDTPIEKFDEVEYEIREGYPDDDPITLYPQQVIEEVLGVELRRDRLRNDAGTIIGTGPETPVARFTAGDATEANVILSWPSGLTDVHESGGDAGELKPTTVVIRIRQRPASGGSWQEVTTLSVRAEKREGFYRSHRWALPSRGRWEIELTRVTHEAEETEIVDKTVWLALQSFRPEKPVNFDKPLCLVSLRVKATYQLNSQLDTFNAIAERLVPDYDHTTGEWTLRKSRNPASYYRLALQGPECAFPEADRSLDLDQFEDFHDFCRTKGLKYDRIHEAAASQWDALTEITGAGRAAPRFDGTKWGVIIDRPQDLVVAHVNDRNSRNFGWSHGYPKPPHAFRVAFLDQTSDFQQRERLVRWPGYTGDITVTEHLEMPGKTDPDEIWIEARRRQYEAIYRPTQFSAVQDGAVRTATRGDRVKGSFPVISRVMSGHRVKAVRGQLVTLDGIVEMEPGQSYALRFMVEEGEGEAATTSSIVRIIMPFAGETDSVALSGDGPLPKAGDIVHFGLAGQESYDLVVAGVQSGQAMTSVLTMLHAAPIIDQLTDAEVPPAWNGRAGQDAGLDVAIPAIPKVLAIEPYFDAVGDPDGVLVRLEAGEGSPAVVGTFTLRHRLAGTTTWTLNAPVPAADGMVIATGYSSGAEIEMQRLATSIYGYSSDWSDIFTSTGAETPPLPQPDPITSGSVTGGTGQATFDLTTPNDPLVTAVALYYGPNSDGTGVTEIVAFTAAPNSHYSRTETVPAGIWWFFAVTENDEGTQSVGFSLGQETIS
ncbi:phage tail protein [Pelagibacterium sp. 26DY04]|uniref:host specificity protein J n=1 Tax=Pelagibacterium sp. 26DY04 TaxID=2967130 RepID=UPI002814E099|nr:phage tail protein [Pelagibacterium sp. 26DY04]WMT85557.1 phage tail protein [Pelagibacterium sp. 26DY04]